MLRGKVIIEIAKSGSGTYTTRQQREAYTGNFASENDPLKPDNTIPWEKNAKTAET